MTTVLAPPTALPFPFVGPEHPFAGRIDDFRARLAAEPRTSAWLADPATIVHTELKGRPLDGGGFAIDRMYCSMQRAVRAPESESAFEALSLCFAAKHGRTDWYAFPDEPYLAALRPFVEGDALARRPGVPRLAVLRYVPLRRFTFRGELSARPGEQVIGKFKRRSRVHAAHERSVAIARAVAAARRPFAVPAPLGVDAEHAICFQGVVPGRPLSDVPAGDPGFADGMAEAGTLQHAFHRLPAHDLPLWDQRAFLSAIARDLAWIAFLRPETRAALERATSVVAGGIAPLAPEALVACHGDFVPSHLLRSADGWAIIDLDLAQRADPLWELAMALAVLPRDVPSLAEACADGGADPGALLEAAEEAYLIGYETAARGGVDEARLAFWRVCAAVYELALMLTKDRYEPVAFARAVARVEALAERVPAERVR